MVVRKAHSEPMRVSGVGEDAQEDGEQLMLQHEVYELSQRQAGCEFGLAWMAMQ